MCRKFRIIIIEEIFWPQLIHNRLSEISKRSYCAKILFFGEYTIVDGGDALSIPFEQLSAHWTSHFSSTNLLEFFNFLMTLHFLDHNAIAHAIENNLRFTSKIPIGYGLGSSGALSAAAYDLFGVEKQSNNLGQLQSELSQIESFFHGKSSGLDPLTIFLNKIILVRNRQPIVSDIVLSDKPFFLFDSNQSRNTSRLIKIYNEKKRSEKGFIHALEQLDQLNKQAISALLDSKDVSHIFQKISQLQLLHFKEMIPDHIHTVWNEGLMSGNYSMKLSGAGGGGYFLLYRSNENGLSSLDSALVKKV